MAGQPLTVGSLVRARIYAFDTNQLGVNTFWFTVQSVGSPAATDQDVATQLDGNVGTAFKAILNNNAQYRGVQTQLCDSLGHPQYVDQIAVANAGYGVAGATSLPRQVAGITSWYTVLPKQANRGRTYWPFPADADDSGDGLPSASYVTRLNSLCNQIFLTVNIAVGGRTASIAQRLFHRKVPGSTAIASFFNRQAWATQRRRGTFGRPQGVPPF